MKGNTLADNTRSCRGQEFGEKFSGIGIALLGASGMHLTANHIWGNVPTGPTLISGGVVVSKDPYFQGTNFGGTQKPTNNTAVANHFGRNKLATSGTTSFAGCPGRDVVPGTAWERPGSRSGPGPAPASILA